MYSETYAHLKSKYNYDNFEVIAEAIEKHFSDLFKLAVLDNEAHIGNSSGSYVKLFDECMRQLTGLYTVEEVVGKLYETIQGPSVKDKLEKGFIFVPPIGLQVSRQINYLEKLATNDAKVAEPLSFIDMMRVANGLRHLKKNDVAKDVGVVHLNNLVVPNALDIDELKQKDALMVNFNRDLKGTPKWGVINLLDKTTPVIYCETPLTEREKAEIQNALGIQLTEEQFKGATANSLPSTGYMAIAWLDNNVTKAWNFDVSTDFTALLKEFIMGYFGGDNPGLSYSFIENERTKYCSPAFQEVLKITGFYEKEYSANDYTQPGFGISRSTWLAGLGKIGDESFRPGDLGKAVQIVGSADWAYPQMEPHLYRYNRTLPPGFAATLSRHQLAYGSPLVAQTANSVTLNIPESLDTYALERTHETECAKTNTYSGWPDTLWQKLGTKQGGTKEEFYATMIVLGLVRSKAKKQILTLNVPNNYQLNKEEQQFVIQTLLENPYVTEFNINETLNSPNKSLEQVKLALIPTFARNRWLAANGYRPPLVDNYWRQAARYWLVHLNQVPNLLQPKMEHELFKNCVREMGLQGLKEVLELLNDEIEREFFETLYGKDKPAFYAACLPDQYPEYLDTLLGHLQVEAYFPFGELGISYQPGNNDKLVSVISELNKLRQFERVSFTDCLKRTAYCKGFLQTLVHEAQAQRWTGLIVIPELEDQSSNNDSLRELRVMYTFLNDIILHNRHLKAAEEEIKSINEATDFTMPGTEDDETEIKTEGEKAEKTDSEEFDRIIEHSLGSINKESKWPLKKGGTVQLQLQQQQQIEQNRQMQQEQQKVVINILEAAIAGELVDYANIDRLLNKFLKEFEKENTVEHNAATLRTSRETLLQGFFHTWINANPQVNATHVIKQMTPEAAQALLRKHTRLPSGLNPENLPKGFYTQRSKDGNLILCYSPELSYVNSPNALTLDLSVNIPKSEAWEGDFRQFNLSKYSTFSAEFDEEDWENMVLFTRMQPPKRSYDKDYELFQKTNGRLIGKIDISTSANRKKITEFWPIFLQAWQYGGAKGVEQFIAEPNRSFILSEGAIKGLLLSKVASMELRRWAAELDMDDQYLRALGQIYYRYGEAGLTTFLSKMRQFEAVLGAEFFDHFNEEVLSRSENFNCFMSKSFVMTLDDMMDKLKSREAQGKLKVWEKMITIHMHALGWENIDALWRGYSHFTAELEQLGLKLEGDEFDKVKPENMLICMDRILNSLNQIPDYEMQKQFLAKLDSFDLTYGGVHYALQHEGFKYFDHELKLHDFDLGSPTYTPDLVSLYKWTSNDAALKMKRTLASKAQFSQQAYQLLVEKLGNDEIESRHQLLWLLHTHYSAVDMPTILEQLDHVATDFQELIARHLYNAVYVLGNKQLNISFDAVQALASLVQAPHLSTLLTAYPNGTFLEAASILFQSKRWNVQEVNKLVSLFSAKIAKPADYPDHLYREGYKLATLFGVTEPTQLQEFYTATKDLKPVVQIELRLLMNQLLSIDYATSNLDALVDRANWGEFIQCIDAMKKDMAHTTTHRIELIDKFDALGIQFKYSKSGEFRALSPSPEDKPAELGFFVDHEDRLWEFMLQHIVVPTEGDAKEALKPIVRFLKKLQLNRTYLNEIEPLLSSLEKAPEGHYWSATYFYQLLRALQPENDQASFPISLLKVILEEKSIAPKKINSVEKDFPVELAEPLQTILKNSVFNRQQQGILCQIALREYNWKGSIALLNQIMGTLSIEGYANSRTYALEILAKSKDFPDMETRFENCRWLLQHAPSVEIAPQWTKTTALWLKSLSARKQEEDLFSKVKAKFADNGDKLSLVLHILAFSTLSRGLKDNESYEHELNTKAVKLIDRLDAMEDGDLIKLAKSYPKQPSPSADDILRLIKKQRKEGITWSASFETFERQPFTEPRTDFGLVAATRDADLQRMISETKVSAKDARQGLSTEKAARLTLIFGYLKRLENGTEHLKGSAVPIAKMAPQELAKAFQTLSKASPQDDLTRAQIWAVLFEVLGRTTRKYPHLAQQFALIANDIGVDAPTRVLQLATGEGKSHFVAMRAARHAGQGKTVDVCTAKRTLAERDLEDYQNLFDYLNIKTAYIHPKSSHAAYADAQIHYSTLGDLSLFLDEQSYSGQPIEIDPRDRVALFDEFDFIRFEEGRKTEYNYARPTGKTPKQMNWFYQSVNKFYTTNQDELKATGEISLETLRQFVKALKADVGENEERYNLVRPMLHDPLQLVQWLQSAVEAHSLEWGINFTVREEDIEASDESYPMREVIPLSTDNQKMVGSTFSAGVHQLLAVRLNTEARLTKDPQNFHIHPESNIISSQVAAQRMKKLWSAWEGFSGTISAAQAATLNREQGTQVLHVPTNQRDLRLWHKPNFHASEDARLESIIKQIKTCIDKKQSMLFSCKNDKQVQELQEKLSKKFSTEELEQHFIFYTNEEHRTAAEVLTDKTAKEDWHGGKKQHGVGLVASGFGRGDNVDVEAVFLFDVNDTNDKLQKGGRTARNGAEGEVFQFYLEDELVQEEQRLWDLLNVIEPHTVSHLKNQLHHVLGDSENEHCFERVMLLREYVFSLQNAANQGYHNAIAQYSSWGMKTLGGVEDPATRQVLTTNFSLQLKRLDKLWINISSQDKLSVDEKITAIEEQVTTISADFSKRCEEIELTIAPFALDAHQPTEIQMVVPVAPQKPSIEDRAVASICSVMSRLPDLTLRNSPVAGIPQVLGALAMNSKKLQQFAIQIASCTSTAEFVHKLKLAAIQATKPSKAWEDLESTASQEIEGNELFEGVSDKVRTRCALALNALVPALQEQIIASLSAPALLSNEARINEAFPLLEYLGKFSIKQQTMWGADFIAQMHALPNQMTPELLSLCLDASEPMSCSDFTVFGTILRLTSEKESQLAKEELTALYKQLARATRAEPEQRIRMLTKWESWTKYIPNEQYKKFLTTFCHSMEHFKEGENWDTFTALVRKTQDWINKGGQASYVPELLSVWDGLSNHVNDLSKMNGYLQWATKLGGKTWFQLINAAMHLSPTETFQTHLHQFKGYWKSLDATPLKKQAKIDKFHECCDKINLFYQTINGLSSAQRTLMKNRFLALDDEKFALMIDFTGELTASQPQALAEMLSYLSDTSISFSRSQLLSKVIIQATDYQKRNPHFDHRQLMNAIQRFKGCNENTLELLLHLMDQNKETAQTVEPLFDNTVFHLDKHVPAAARNNVEEIIQLFYQAAKDTKGYLSAISSKPSVVALFDFNNDSKERQNQRLIFMHLLQQQVFVKDKISSEHQDYKWNYERNEQLLQHGLNCYVQHTQQVLDAKPAKAHVHHKRDLTVKQQHELLKLTDELAIIGKPSMSPRTDLQEQAQKAATLSQGLNKLMRNYQATWFKSSDRKAQAVELQTSLHIEGAPRYQDVLRAISEAKLKAIQSDEAQNQVRWFKMNRSGQSRYFNTLNQMQDLVLRQWSLDIKELHGFTAFKAHNQQEFVQLVRCLQEATAQYYDDNYPTPDNPRYNDTRQQLGRFFGSVKNRTALESLVKTLGQFEEEMRSGVLSAEMVNTLMNELRQDVPTLPGHLVTLANEVLIRGDSLHLNLSEQAGHEEVRASFKGEL